MAWGSGCSVEEVATAVREVIADGSPELWADLHRDEQGFFAGFSTRFPPKRG